MAVIDIMKNQLKDTCEFVYYLHLFIHFISNKVYQKNKEKKKIKQNIPQDLYNGNNRKIMPFDPEFPESKFADNNFKLFTTQSRLLTTLYKKPFENIVGKGENAGNQHFLLFPQCFLPFPQ